MRAFILLALFCLISLSFGDPPTGSGTFILFLFSRFMKIGTKINFIVCFRLLFIQQNGD